MSEATIDRIRRRPVWFIDLDGTLVDSIPVHAASAGEPDPAVYRELLGSEKLGGVDG